MENRKVGSITFVVEANCTCDGCKEKFSKLKKKNGGVHSISIDAERGRATITGTAGPYQVIEELRKYGKKVKLLRVEPSPKHSKCISSPQRPIQKVVPTPPVHNISTVKNTGHCCFSAPSHKLKLIEGHIKRFTCNRCKMDGIRSRYRCEECPFEIHKECKNPKLTTSPDYFKGLTFSYRDEQRRRPSSRSDAGGRHKPSCAACGEFIRGHFYSSDDEKGMYLHPSCSKLRQRESLGGIEFVLEHRPSERCMWCESDKDARCQVPGWVYMSRCGTYRLHVNCITKLVHHAWMEGFVLDAKDAWASVESLDLELEAKLRRKTGKGLNFWRPVGLLLKAVVGLLFGDVTGIVPMVVALVGILSK